MAKIIHTKSSYSSGPPVNAYVNSPVAITATLGSKTSKTKDFTSIDLRDSDYIPQLLFDYLIKYSYII